MASSPSASPSRPRDIHAADPTPKSHAGPAADRARTPLQKHVAFFDRNNDGFISPTETYRGCRLMGASRLMSGLAATFIHGTMAWPTSRSWLPTVRIDVRRINRAMHGSDTRTYDETGSFDGAKFDAMFSRYDTDSDGAWGVGEFLKRTWAQRNVVDPFGLTATLLEFGMMYYLVGRDGRLHRDDLRRAYDGSLFYDLAERHAEQQ